MNIIGRFVPVQKILKILYNVQKTVVRKNSLKVYHAPCKNCISPFIVSNELQISDFIIEFHILIISTNRNIFF